MNFEEQKAIFELYIDSSKTLMQFSGAALALSITFVEKILGEKALRRRDTLLCASWVMFLLTIGIAILYQYLAIGVLAGDAWEKRWLSKLLGGHTGLVYGAMQITFYSGAVLFTSAAFRRMRDMR